MKTDITNSVLLRIREIAALLLWEIGAIRVNLNEPFRLVSGNYSPIYINCRLVISNPVFMHLFTAFVRTIVVRNEISVDIVAGGETAGIPFAAYLANDLSLPMIYVRKASKGHGIGSLVEGYFFKSAKVLLVEDLITDARSKIGFIDAIKGSGGVVENVLVLFDRQQGGGETLHTSGIHLDAVTDMSTVMAIAADTRLLSDSQLKSVHEYLDSPQGWHRERSLSFAE